MKTYAIKDTFKLVQTGGIPREYALPLRDLPPEEKPREKMLKFGAHTLSSQELMAVVLNTGTKKEDVMSMCNRLLKEYGAHALTGKVDPHKLSKEFEIPLGKAMQVVACAELGKRFFDKKGGQTPVLRTAKDVFEYLKDMRDLPREHLRGLYLNAHYKLIHDEVISIGTVDANIIHPREVFRPALEYGAVAVILAHNHPSGDVTASRADESITKEIVEAGKIMGVRLLDHVIIGKDTFTSVDINY